MIPLDRLGCLRSSPRRSRSAVPAAEEALDSEDRGLEHRATEEHARALLNGLRDRRVGMHAVVDVLERRAEVNEERDPLDRARRLRTDDAQAEDPRRVALREELDEAARRPHRDVP